MRPVLTSRGIGRPPRAAPAHAVTKTKPPTPVVLRIVETLLAVGVASCVVVVHDVPYLLSTPFWLDEAWVAVSTRYPVGQLHSVTSSTPLGWTFLLRLVPGSGQQDLRLLPLLFAALTVLAAYHLAWGLRTLPIVAGLLAGGAALMVPAMVIRDDLKQYTADAFVTILALALVAGLEARWSRRRLAALVVILSLGALVSDAGLFEAAAPLCIALVQLIRRDWRRLVETVVAGLAMAVFLGAIFFGIDNGTQTASLKAYWQGFFLPHGFHAAAHYINVRIHQLLPFTGIRHATLLLAVVALGLVVLCVKGRWATAALLPALLVENVVLAAAQKYPLFDERTSTYLLTAALVVAAIGVAGAAELLARRIHAVAGVAVAGLAAGVYLSGVVSFVDYRAIPFEDVRAQTAYVTAHARPGDVVLISWDAAYGFGYYSPKRPEIVPDTGTGFAVHYPPSDRIIALTARTAAAVDSGVQEARRLLRSHPGATLWLVVNHEASAEVPAWADAYTSLHVHTVYVGPGGTAVRYAGPG